MSQVVVYKMPKIMENDINQSPQNMDTVAYKRCLFITGYQYWAF